MIAVVSLIVGGARPLLVERVHEPCDTRALELPEPVRRGRLEPPLGLVEGGLARVRGPPARGHRRRLVRVHEPALPHDEPRQGDRAAQPAGPVPERDGGRRRPALRRLGRLARHGPPATRRRAGPRARAPRVLPARAARHRLGLRRGHRAGVPRRRRARRRRPSGGGFRSRSRCRVGVGARRRSFALRRLARQPLDGQAEQAIGTDNAKVITLARRASRTADRR